MKEINVELQDKNFVSKTFEAKVANLHEVLGFIDGQLEEHDCSMKSQMQIDIAAEELYTNIALYAYGQLGGYARIDVGFFDNKVLVRLIDNGMPFNPLAKEDPDITLTAEERDIGGLGIYMVKETMNEVRYEYTNEHNILTFIKEIC